MTESADFLIVGAGIIGLPVARELRRRHPESCVVVLEKELRVGCHASGRNGGPSPSFFQERHLRR